MENLRLKGWLVLDNPFGGRLRGEELATYCFIQVHTNSCKSCRYKIVWLSVAGSALESLLGCWTLDFNFSIKFSILGNKLGNGPVSNIPVFHSHSERNVMGMGMLFLKIGGMGTGMGMPF